MLLNFCVNWLPEWISTMPFAHKCPASVYWLWDMSKVSIRTWHPTTENGNLTLFVGCGVGRYYISAKLYGASYKLHQFLQLSCKCHNKTREKKTTFRQRLKDNIPLARAKACKPTYTSNFITNFNLPFIRTFCWFRSLKTAHTTPVKTNTHKYLLCVYVIICLLPHIILVGVANFSIYIFVIVNHTMFDAVFSPFMSLASLFQENVHLVMRSGGISWQFWYFWYLYSSGLAGFHTQKTNTRRFIHLQTLVTSLCDCYVATRWNIFPRHSTSSANWISCLAFMCRQSGQIVIISLSSRVWLVNLHHNACNASQHSMCCSNNVDATTK